MAGQPNIEAAAGERIAKFLARAGIASRREAERMIAAGRIAIGGAIIETPGTRVPADAIVTVDGKPVAEAERTRLWRYHKPRGLVTTHSDPQGRPTVFAALPKDLPRVISVGRLDLTSEGLLLLTNDGMLARQLELPKTGWTRRYRVRVFGKVLTSDLEKLANGLVVDGTRYGPIEAELDREQSKGHNIWLTVGLKEGKNREIRRVMEHLGLKVSRLIRVAYGPFQLGKLAESSVEEVPGRVLKDQLGTTFAPEKKKRADRKA